MVKLQEAGGAGGIDEAQDEAGRVCRGVARDGVWAFAEDGCWGR